MAAGVDAADGFEGRGKTVTLGNVGTTLAGLGGHAESRPRPAPVGGRTADMLQPFLSYLARMLFG